MRQFTVILVFSLFSFSALAGQVSTKIYSTDTNKPLGQVVFQDTEYGLLITPDLQALPTGLHGFHLHEHPNCGDKGKAAGGHFDPKNTKTHQGPYGQGHLGDLPVLFVTEDGKATTPTLAPRLKTSDLKAVALIVHGGGDTYSDQPNLGGGGARIACGVIK